MRFWIATFVDVAHQGIRERLDAMGEWRTHDSHGVARAQPVLLARYATGALLLIAAASNVVYDVLSIKNSMGIFAMLLTAVGATGGFFLIRPPGPRRPC